MSNLENGERQVAPSIDGIRRDHVARYEWAAKTLPPNSHVLDVACGVGYGAFILAEAGHTVLGIDRDQEAIAYAELHYRHENATFQIGLAELAETGLAHITFDAVVCFETIEHIEHPAPFLAVLRRAAPILLASVPNEAVFPHRGLIKFHHRHYRPHEFKDLIEAAGFQIEAWHGQADHIGEVEPDRMGRTIIVTARRSDVVVAPPALAKPEDPVKPAPKHVSIVGLGPSDAAYLDMIKRMGGRRAYSDETWVINAHGDVLAADRIFHMDDVRIQQARAEERPGGNIAKMLEWMRGHPGPIYTSRAHPDYPGLVEFPLQGVINKLGYDYFNNTAAYAIAYAIYLGVERISFFGCDFTYPDAHDAEKGRGCCEYWIGVAMSRGIQITVSGKSTLLDANVPADQRLYGYDTVDVDIVEQPDRSVKVEFRERQKVATAAEIEDRYDHTKHPAGEMAETG